MDPFLKYLIIINIITFLAFTIDLFLCLRIPGFEDKAANSLVLDLFPIAGGAAGMLLALFFLTGLGRGHRMNKDNIAWWFLAIVCLVIWTLIGAVRLGFVRMDFELVSKMSSWRVERLTILGVYLIAINIFTFCAFAWDKHVAENGNDLKRRAPEARLLGLSIIGGSVGGLLAIHIVRHKTRKWYFVWGLPCFIVLNVVIILCLHASGLV